MSHLYGAHDTHVIRAVGAHTTRKYIMGWVGIGQIMLAEVRFVEVKIYYAVLG
jgi:hypothetical protein